MKIILLGAPGADKGTQSEIISRRLGIPTISTDNILRAAVKEGIPIDLQVKSYTDAGKLVLDEIIVGIIQERPVEPDCASGFILDGVPRAIAQAEALECYGTRFDVVFFLEVVDSVIEARMADRQACHVCGATYHVAMAPPKQEGFCDKCGDVLEQRKDDQPGTAKQRPEAYHSQAESLEGLYEEKGVLRHVPDLGSIEETNTKIMELLGK